MHDIILLYLHFRQVLRMLKRLPVDNDYIGKSLFVPRRRRYPLTLYIIVF